MTEPKESSIYLAVLYIDIIIEKIKFFSIEVLIKIDNNNNAIV